MGRKTFNSLEKSHLQLLLVVLSGKHFSDTQSGIVFHIRYNVDNIFSDTCFRSACNNKNIRIGWVIHFILKYEHWKIMRYTPSCLMMFLKL